MTELSLHILDIVQNSITANGTFIEIIINEDTINNKLTITITDNGYGMSEEMLAKVCDPFTTTRKTRPVGMGISLFKSAANLCGGDLTIKSKQGIGTTVIVDFIHNHIDRQPIGNMSETFATLVMGNPDVDFSYTHIIDDKSFNINTCEIKNVMGEVPINNFEVVMWIKDNIKSELENIGGNNL